MTKKLEELLNLPDSKEIVNDAKKEDKKQKKEVPLVEQSETIRNIAELDKITSALPAVKGLGEMADTELNDVADKAMSAYDDLMDLYGAVSVEVVTQMALKVKELFQSDFVIAESGIASPIVGSQKSSGLYFIGCFSDKSSVVEQFQFEGYRDQIMNEAALHAFKILNESLVD